MFVLYGPNTNHGSGSVPFTLESQFNYIIDAVERLRDGGYRWLDLRPEAQDRWREEMAERSRDTVWMAGGCHNWYLNATRREHQQLAGRLAGVPPPYAPAQPRRLPGRGLDTGPAHDRAQGDPRVGFAGAAVGLQ